MDTAPVRTLQTLEFTASCMVEAPTRARDVLVEARARIADVARWTRGASARMCLLPLVNPNSPYAIAWSADGAVHRAAGGAWMLCGREALRVLASAASIPATDVAKWNDTVPHTTILDAFDRAIAALEAVEARRAGKAVPAT